MKESLNFLDKMVKEDLENDVYNEIMTRFPPEPNGYIHIGNAYAINISYSIALHNNGKFNLRFDDTNPHREDMEYVEAIKDDMLWMGFDFENRVYFGSDYSEQIYHYAIELIKKGRAYVCDLSSKEIKEYRGTLKTPGINSPYRDRTVEENLDLFIKMKEGVFKEGEKVLRAKIDMKSPNINLRDPVIYRISYTPHYRTGTDWCIYPMYDYAHPIQDYIEGVSHSLCSIEFSDHRPLYEWVLNSLELEKPIPRQIEFGRVSISGVVTSKRYLRKLVFDHIVDGWDDPRLPTIKGLRRRGYTKESIHHFLKEIGIPRNMSTIHISMLEQSLRQDLKAKVPTLMTILDPIKVVITNLEDDHLEYLEADNNKENEALGKRVIPFTKNLYIERDDFNENPPKKYNRLTLGGEVRLMHAYFIRCNEIIKDANGNIIELRCTYDPKTKSGSGFNERKVKGTIHWVSATESISCTVRKFYPLFNEVPSEKTFYDVINPNSIEILENAYIEKSEVTNDNIRFQFIRHGFYIKDSKLSSDDNLVFNEIVSLKSSYK